jgi:hypothetical protein
MISLTIIDHMFDLIMHLIADVVTYFGSHGLDAASAGAVVPLLAVIRGRPAQRRDRGSLGTP